MTTPISEEDLRIRIHHIGGIGVNGATEILTNLGHVEWVVYDAQAESLSRSLLPKAAHRLVRRAIGGPASGRSKFYVSRWSSASSLLKPAADAEDYAMVTLEGGLQVWGTHSETVKTEELQVDSLDGLLERREIPPLDFLSIDAQGEELAIIEGASGSLRDSVLGIVCEVEFSALYEGQSLFDGIQARLRADGFRLCDLFDLQYFNTVPTPLEFRGKGFLTTCEALFLKQTTGRNMLGATQLSDRDVISALKLAAIAVAFDQLDYAISICNELERRNLVSLNELAERTNVKYICMLRDLCRTAESKVSTRVVLEAPEEGDGSACPTRSYVAARVMLVVFALVIRRILGRIVRSMTGRNLPWNSPRTAGILYKYGFEGLAIKHAIRAANIPYLGSSAAASYLDMLITFATKFL